MIEYELFNMNQGQRSLLPNHGFNHCENVLIGVK